MAWTEVGWCAGGIENKGLTHQYISIYSFGRRQHGSSESLLMLLLVYLAREKEADGRRETENTDNHNHQHTVVLEMT